MPSSNAETAERLNRRRARMLPVLALFVLIQQAAYFGSGDRLRTVDLVRNSAWIVLVAVILAGLLTGGFWFRSREVRELMNDEVTRANRASALAWGFTMAIVAAIKATARARRPPRRNASAAGGKRRTSTARPRARCSTR